MLNGFSLMEILICFLSLSYSKNIIDNKLIIIPAIGRPTKNSGAMNFETGDLSRLDIKSSKMLII